MGMIEAYKQVIHKEFTSRAKGRIANAPELSKHLIVNADQSEFIVLTVGWHKKKYHHGVTFHVEIKENKVWIHQDNTDVDIASIFVAEGIPKSDIILGFLPWYAQEVQEYGAG